MLTTDLRSRSLDLNTAAFSWHIPYYLQCIMQNMLSKPFPVSGYIRNSFKCARIFDGSNLKFVKPRINARTHACTHTNEQTQTNKHKLLWSNKKKNSKYSTIKCIVQQSDTHSWYSLLIYFSNLVTPSLLGGKSYNIVLTFFHVKYFPKVGNSAELKSTQLNSKFQLSTFTPVKSYLWGTFRELSPLEEPARWSTGGKRKGQNQCCSIWSEIMHFNKNDSCLMFGLRQCGL